MARSMDVLSVPLRYPTAAIFVDESGSKSTAGRFFVVGAVKVRQVGLLARAIREVRDRTGYSGELKFSAITRGSLTVYSELIAALEASDANLAACVVQGSVYNRFGSARRSGRSTRRSRRSYSSAASIAGSSWECTWTGSPRRRDARLKTRSAG